MSKHALLISIIVLSLAGLADAWYLAQAALTHTALICGPATLDGCNTVAQSSYSRLLGIPLAVYGVGFYILLFIIAAVRLTSSRAWLTTALVIVSTAGLLMSVYFEYVQVALIKAICIYCLGSFIVAALICGLSWRLRSLVRRETSAVLP